MDKEARTISDLKARIKELEEELEGYKIYCGEAKDHAKRAWVINLRSYLKARGHEGSNSALLVACAVLGPGAHSYERLFFTYKSLSFYKRDSGDPIGVMRVVACRVNKVLTDLGFLPRLEVVRAFGFKVDQELVEWVKLFKP